MTCVGRFFGLYIIGHDWYKRKGNNVMNSVVSEKMLRSLQIRKIYCS